MLGIISKTTPNEFHCNQHANSLCSNVIYGQKPEKEQNEE